MPPDLTPPPDEAVRLHASDGTPLHARFWTPPAPRAVVVLVHGLFDHAGRYGHVVAALTARRLAVAAYDQRGHGTSGGTRGFAPSLDVLLDDLGLVLSHVRARHPDRPVVLLGHSMGGMLAAAFAGERAEEAGLTALVLSAPYLDAARVPAPLVAALQLLARLLPHLPTVRIDAADVSRDPAVVEGYRTDPLIVRRRIPASTAAMLWTGARRAWAAAAGLRAPLLILQGGADRIASPDAVRAFYGRAGAPDKTLEWYGPFYHEVLNEPARAHVLADLGAWLDARVGGAA